MSEGTQFAIYIAVLVALYFLFAGEPDVFDVLRAGVIGGCKP